MKAWSHVCRAAFTPAECEALVRHAQAQGAAREGQVGLRGEYGVEPKMRRTQVRWLRRDDAALAALYFRVMSLAETANGESFGFDLRGFREVQFGEYAAECAGHYDWHTDNDWVDGRAECRKMSFVLQLSAAADYEGGRLELSQGNVTLAQGDCVFFPAFNRHRVTPVTRGVRRSLVTWFRGPAFC